MQIPAALFFLLSLFLNLATSSDTTKEIILTQTLFDLTTNNQCTTNYALIDQYFTLLKQKNIELSTPRKNRDEIEEIVNRLNFQKVVEDLSSPIYKICPFKVSQYDRTPDINNTLVNLSISHTLQKYPYLHQNLAPSRIAQLIDFLPIQVKTQFSIMRYHILNHELYVQTPTFMTQQDSLHRNLRPFLDELPDMVFVVFKRDELHVNVIKDIMQDKKANHSELDGYVEIYKRIMIDIPGFMRSKSLYDSIQFNKMLVMDPYVLRSRWPGIIESIKKVSKQTPWESKIQKSFFRGKLSGSTYEDIDQYSDITKYFIRLHTMNLSNTYPDLLDHKTNDFDKVPKEVKERLNISYEITGDVPREDHLKYKYLLSIDGWSAVWERIAWIMFSNSLLLKHETGKVQWFHHQILPYVHYIPLKADLSDIAQKILYLRAHDELARNITLNANKFAEKRFHYHQLHRQLIQILKEYAGYQKYQLGFLQKMNIKLNSPKSLPEMAESLRNLKIKVGSCIVLLLIVYLCILILKGKFKYNGQGGVKQRQEGSFGSDLVTNQ